MMDTGVMHVEVYIDECRNQKIEFIVGFRMNHRHGHNINYCDKITKEHPEWMLKEYKPTSGDADPRSRELGSALDCLQDGVRDWLCSIMEEVSNHFDVDSIEWNCTRMIQCFPSDKAEKNHAIITGFVRRVRAMLDEAGQERAVSSSHNGSCVQIKGGSGFSLLSPAQKTAFETSVSSWS